MLAFEPDLDANDRDFLAEHFRPHPGRAVLDAAVMSAHVESQPTTYAALATDGPEEAWQNAPGVALGASGWRRRHLASGHWPMLSIPEALAGLLMDEVQHYSKPRSR